MDRFSHGCSLLLFLLDDLIRSDTVVCVLWEHRRHVVSSAQAVPSDDTKQNWWLTRAKAPPPRGPAAVSQVSHEAGSPVLAGNACHRWLVQRTW